MKKSKAIQAILTTLFVLWGFGALAGSWIQESHASYRTGISGNIGARVARFSVDVGEPELLSEDAVLDCNKPGDSVRFRIPIQNQSEVIAEYAVTVSGYGESVLCNVENGSGTLACNGGSAVAEVTFSLKSLTDKTQPIVLDSIKANVTVNQKEGS